MESDRDPRFDRVWNPLKRFPRNHACFCGSGKKAKYCHMTKLSHTMLRKDAELVKRIWAGLLAGTDFLHFNTLRIQDSTAKHPGQQEH